MKKLPSIALIIGIVAVIIVVLYFVMHKKSSTQNIPATTPDIVTPAPTASLVNPSSLKYISATEWPAKTEILTGAYSCKTTEKIIDGKKYCVTIESEGAAGSTYNQYTFLTQANDKLLSTTFTLRFPQCGNYNEDEAYQCEFDQKTFLPSSLIEPVTKMCYQYTQEATPTAPYDVSEYLELTTNGTDFVGKKEGQQSGPDMTNGYVGFLTGTKQENNFTFVFDYVVEDSRNKEQEEYTISGSDLIKHRYPQRRPR
jgi:hypothetical protein